jgi:YD repeat-containing protein
MGSRAQNEQKFEHWKELPNGGRRYTRDFAGRAGGRARYIKEVDPTEQTTRFAQEIYDASGRLVAMHERFPVDLGHKQL